MIYSNKKGFTFGNILHFSPLKRAKQLGLGDMQNIFAILLPLPQTAAAKYITQMLGGDNRR